MTTLAGRKIRRYREAQTPKLTRHEFGERVGVPFSTVQGWEEDGKIPRTATLARLVATGVVAHADFFAPADCSCCGMATDAAEVAHCRRDGCPLAIDRRAVA